MEQLLSMRLHSRLRFNDGFLEVTRVPGGWIYDVLSGANNNPHMVNSIFVPFCEDKILSEFAFYDKTRDTDAGPLDF